MSGTPVASRKYQFVSPPRAYAASGKPGQVAAFAVSAVAKVMDLSLGVSQAAKDLSKSGQDPASPTRNYVTIVADVDLGVVFGPTLASVTGGNAPALAGVGTLDANGVYTPAATVCHLIQAKVPQRFLLQPGVDKFLGIVASGAGTARVYQSSPDDA